MPIDSVAAVQQRIAAIEARTRALAAPIRQPATGAGYARGYASLGTPDANATSFAGQLRAALLSADATEGLTPAASATGKVGGVDVPDELRRYGNGRIPADALVPIGIGQHRLWGPAARAFTAMRAAAAADGVQIGVTDSYRSYAQQVDVANRKGLYRNGGLAAVPGTSNHGWGMALDVDVDDRGQAWLRANAARFGWVESVPREPWHWEYQPA